MKNNFSRIILIVLGLTILITSVSVGVSAANYGNFEYTVNEDDTVTITGYNGNENNIIIPTYINNKTVTEIGDMAFMDNHTLVSIAIPLSVTQIGDYAFYNCSSLANISVNRVEEIGAFAFAYCISLSKIVIPETAQRIGYLAYDECYPMDGVNFTSPDTVIEDGVFDGCDNLTIYGFANSTAYAYALTNDIEFCEFSPESTFTDVSADQWYYDAVRFVTSYNLLQGTSATTFNPNGTATRATIVVILWRIEGAPTGYTSNFSDVPEGAFYEQAVAWAQSVGVVNGTPGGTFNPTGIINKEQLILFFYKYAQYKDYKTDSTGFDTSLITDYNSASSYLRDSIAWAGKYGIISTPAAFNPKNNAMRSVIATVSRSFVLNVEC